MSVVTAGRSARMEWADIVTHRVMIGVVSGLFILPNVLFASWLRPLPGAILLLGSLGSLALTLRSRAVEKTWLHEPVEFGRLGALLALATALLVLGGEGHLFYANLDWLIRDAVLADLVSSKGPPAFSLPEGEYVLRAPVGMYMLPAAVGRSFGLPAAHAALVAQNATLLGAILYVLTSGARGPARLAILLLFAGICILPRAAVVFGLGRDVSDLFNTVRPLDEWSVLQYSGSITQLFWVPNHALPGWWVAALAILCGRRQIHASLLLTTIAFLVIWSPLAILPGVPFAVYLAGRDGWQAVFSRPYWASAVIGCCFLPVAGFLVLGSSEIAHALPANEAGFWGLLNVFFVVQLPAAIFVLLRRTRLSPHLRGLFTISVAVLLALPFVSFGPGNDLVMRGSIPALVILALCFADVVLNPRPEPVLWKVSALALITAGSLSALVEVARAIGTPRFPISECTLMEATAATGSTGLPTNYIVKAERVPDWLMGVPDARLSSATDRDCWPNLQQPGRP